MKSKNQKIASVFQAMFFNRCSPEQIEAHLKQLSGLLNISTFHFNNELQTQHINLTNGLAVSTHLASKCFEDYLRTYNFMFGAYRAVLAQLANNPNIPVKILYAGTGPFCTIILPILYLSKVNQISITTLEINTDSYSFSKKVISSLGKEGYFDSMQLINALDFHSDEPFDIIISETMDKALSREPQLAIFSHLSKFISETGTLIPQNIKVDLVASSVFLEKPVDYDCHSDSMTRVENWKHRQFVCTLIEANRSFYIKNDMSGTQKLFLKSFQTNQIKANLNELYLLTEVQVYEELKLFEDDSWLTKQYIAYSLSEKNRGKQFNACYLNSESPRIELVPVS